MEGTDEGPKVGGEGGQRRPASCTKVAAGECPGYDVLKASATKHP